MLALIGKNFKTHILQNSWKREQKYSKVSHSNLDNYISDGSIHRDGEVIRSRNQRGNELFVNIINLSSQTIGKYPREYWKCGFNLRKNIRVKKERGPAIKIRSVSKSLSPLFNSSDPTPQTKTTSMKKVVLLYIVVIAPSLNITYPFQQL